MTESEYFFPWDKAGGDRIASTLDIRGALRRVKPYSFEEYALCFEAALGDGRPLSKRERYLLARYGKEYADSPGSFHQKLDDLERRLADNVGRFVLIEKSPTFVFIVRLATPNLEFRTAISRSGFPFGTLAIDVTSSISTVVDDNYEIVPELTRDFVDMNRHFRIIADGITQHNLQGYDLTGNPILDSEKPYIHEGDESVVCVGTGEIILWQIDHPKWDEHVENMMMAWKTGLINYPVARKKRFDGSLDFIHRLK